MCPGDRMPAPSSILSPQTTSFSFWGPPHMRYEGWPTLESISMLAGRPHPYEKAVSLAFIHMGCRHRMRVRVIMAWASGAK